MDATLSQIIDHMMLLSLTLRERDQMLEQMQKKVEELQAEITRLMTSQVVVEEKPTKLRKVADNEEEKVPD